MDVMPVLERWIPIVLVSLLFFKIVQVTLGGLFSNLLKPKVIAILALLIVMGILPIPLVRDLAVNGIVMLFTVVHEAYTIVMSGTTPTG